jgi:hypothetical protein
MVCAFYITLVYCGMTSLTHIVPYAEGIGIAKTAAQVSFPCTAFQACSGVLRQDSWVTVSDTSGQWQYA